MVKKSILARFEVKPGKENEVAQFLKNALALAEEEKGTISWYALRIDDRTFGIFDTFNDDQGRDAHLSGPIAKELMARASDLLSKPPTIEKVEILAAKEREGISA